MKSLKKILLVDDDMDDQLLFTEALKDLSSQVFCKLSNNGMEAFEYLLSSAELPAVIFLDLNMPFMNGLQFLAKLQKEERFKYIPVVIFTTSNSPADHAVTQQMGARLYITKPADFRILKEKIREVLKIDFSKPMLSVPFDF